MLKRISKLTTLFILLGITSINTEAQEKSNIINEIIWVVGDEAILKSDVEAYREEMQLSGQRIQGDPYCFIPEQLALKKLLLDQAKIDSVSVSDAEINRNVTQHENRIIANIGSREKLEEYFGVSLMQLREQWRETFRDEQMVDGARRNIIGKKSTLTPSEVRKYYNELSKDSLPFIPTSVEVQIITTEPIIPLKEIDRVKDQLRDFTNDITSGEKSFATLAVMYSEDPGSAHKGGELGFNGRASYLPEFSNVAFSLTDTKKISNIVETEYGFHIIQLIERRGDRANFRHILMKPTVPKEEISKASVKLDSLRTDIVDKKLTFEEATIFSSDKDTRKNEGVMINKGERSDYMKMATSRFTLQELPPEVATAIENVKVGDISKPFSMRLSNTKEVVAIVKVRNRTEGHIANISDDYQALKEIVEGRKEESILDEWLRKKIANTYIRIDKNWINCDFKYSEWVSSHKKNSK